MKTIETAMTPLLDIGLLLVCALVVRVGDRVDVNIPTAPPAAAVGEAPAPSPILTIDVKGNTFLDGTRMSFDAIQSELKKRDVKHVVVHADQDAKYKHIHRVKAVLQNVMGLNITTQGRSE